MTLKKKYSRKKKIRTNKRLLKGGMDKDSPPDSPGTPIPGALAKKRTASENIIPETGLTSFDMYSDPKDWGKKFALELKTFYEGIDEEIKKDYRNTFQTVTDKYKVNTNDEKDKLIKRFFEKLFTLDFKKEGKITGVKAFVYDIIGILAEEDFQKIDAKRRLNDSGTPNFTINESDIDGDFTNFEVLMGKITEDPNGKIINNIVSLKNTLFYNDEGYFKRILGNISEVGFDNTKLLNYFNDNEKISIFSSEAFYNFVIKLNGFIIERITNYLNKIDELKGRYSLSSDPTILNQKIKTVQSSLQSLTTYFDTLNREKQDLLQRGKILYCHKIPDLEDYIEDARAVIKSLFTGIDTQTTFQKLSPQIIENNFDSIKNDKNFNESLIYYYSILQNEMGVTRTTQFQNLKIDEFYKKISKWYTDSLESFYKNSVSNTSLKDDYSNDTDGNGKKLDIQSGENDFETLKFNFVNSLNGLDELIGKSIVDGLRSIFNNKTQDMNIATPKELNDLDDLKNNNDRNEKKLKAIKNLLQVCKQKKTGFSPEIKKNILKKIEDENNDLKELKVQLKELKLDNKKELTILISKNKKKINDLKLELKQTFTSYKTKLSQRNVSNLSDIELSISGGGNEVIINSPDIIHTRVIQLLRSNISSEINQLSITEVQSKLDRKKRGYYRYEKYCELVLKYFENIIMRLEGRYTTGRNFALDKTTQYTIQKRREENLKLDIAEFQEKLNKCKELPNAISSDMLENLEEALVNVQKEKSELDDEIYKEKEKKIKLENDADSDYIRVRGLILKNYDNSIKKLLSIIEKSKKQTKKRRKKRKKKKRSKRKKER